MSFPEALLEKARYRSDSIREALNDPEQNTTSAQFDKSKLPSEPVWDKGSTTKVAVDAPPTGKMMDKTRDPAGVR
ncbi:uncharacterized protein CDV56_108773 [Aspergillus thermomutatus]|uniref:Uncharacterized protein n=1 Tax=Aspergillus thermomutatus TaxID=41047 RepID=A0A397HDP2_ASPTH|nr:uncharacterized protein CDV56_108773 [Aspergillus thermomutatus]RHZ59423.1 hypothetical protein CDV56_108773 [Aspergillus thermomutatus]